MTKTYLPLGSRLALIRLPYKVWLLIHLPRNMNKERFHNQLALNLGYQRIVNDKRINISIDDKRYPDDVMISISVDGFSKPICYKASEGLSQDDMDCFDDNGYDDIKMIVNAVHQAYIQATTYPF